jgi:coenzyme F420-reducing hydrogenase gamma subunit
MCLEEGHMTATQLDEQREARIEEVVDWRFEQLLHAGYDQRDADSLARRTDVDLHQAVDLVLNGCPPELAVSILR